MRPVQRTATGGHRALRRLRTGLTKSALPTAGAYRADAVPARYRRVMAAELIAFVGIAALVIVTPGQDTALTIRNTLLGGRRAGTATALGVASGQAVWTLAASAGVAALIAASEPAFMALKLAGAGYLVLLGLQTLWHALRGKPRAEADERDAPGARRVPAAALRQGLLSNLANPKMAVFFTSLLPQFAPADGPAFPVLFGLGLLFCVMTFAWLCAYAAAVHRARDLLRRRRIQAALDAVMGTTLVALGLRLAAAER
jgi:threonine/homoserine/homoserine lactone efflux protein